MKADISRDTFQPNKHFAAVLQQQGRVQLDADWNEQAAITRRQIELSRRDILGQHGAPADGAGFAIGIVENRTITIGAGRYYVDGILVENDAPVTFITQPDFPQTSNPAGDSLLYLEVWQRLVNALEEPGLRENALGDADTTARLRTVWQVKALPGASSDLSSVSAPPTGRLDARLSNNFLDDDAARVVPFFVGFQGLENQLYRVEVHAGGAAAAASFKWSRDNGIVLTLITSITKRAITVRDLGRDAVLGFSSGQWVEIFSDADELLGRPGRLARIADANQDTLTITLDEKTDLTEIVGKPNFRARRWDGVIEKLVFENSSSTTQFSSIERGIQLSFSNGSYRTGDYWLLPARAGSGLEWSGGPQAPRGIERHFAPLALIGYFEANYTFKSDLRRLFRPLGSSTAAIASPAFHIISLNWEEGSYMSLTKLFTDGLQIRFDAPLGEDPLNGSVQITIEAPYSTPSAWLDTHPLTGLAQRDSVDKSLLVWKPSEKDAYSPVGPTSALRVFYNNVNSIGRSPRIRVYLIGSLLWSSPDGKSRLYLDGSVKAVALGQSRLPSGQGLASSDYNGSFYLTS